MAIGLGLPVALPASADRGGVHPLFGPAGGSDVHVMSFNLRFAAASGAHSWPRRRPIMAELLRHEQPTVIATQEGLHGQLTDVAHDLPDRYDWIGEGRAGGDKDEYVAIFFDTSRLEPLAHEHFWLSDTPDVAGSRSWGNATIRMATWVRFRDRHTGSEFVVLNTHFDNVSETSRVRSAALVRDRVNAFPAGLPVVVTGDFNAPARHSAAYTILTRAGLTDTWVAAPERRSAQYATWHGYYPLIRGGPRIDWMLTRGAVRIHAAGINTYSRGGERASDHLPIQALLTIG
jgi:endonuclease/exonuclease/phosphatase family metal-dependent hydrolase